MQAALELYGERGFDQTTVAEIAERAGLTERTFFRHFADKREVLFSGEVDDLVLNALVDAPRSATPMEAVAAALEAAGDLLEERRDLVRQRQAVIAANPRLREREVIKFARLASAMTDVLRRRGVDELAASLTAEAGIAVLKTRVRTLDRRGQPPRLSPTRPRVARRVEGRDRRPRVAVLRTGNALPESRFPPIVSRSGATRERG